MVIANIPPKTTLAVALGILAPPMLALIDPVIAKASTTDITVAGIRSGRGGVEIVIRGIIPPIRKDEAEANVACQGFVRFSGSRFNSASKWAAIGSCLVNSFATVVAVFLLSPFLS